jgi:hypothetical protein
MIVEEKDVKTDMARPLLSLEVILESKERLPIILGTIFWAGDQYEHSGV